MKDTQAFTVHPYKAWAGDESSFPMDVGVPLHRRDSVGYTYDAIYYNVRQGSWHTVSASNLIEMRQYVANQPDPN